jgi:hypothetical protein
LRDARLEDIVIPKLNLVPHEENFILPAVKSLHHTSFLNGIPSIELRRRELPAWNGVDAMAMAHLMRVDFPLLSPKQTETGIGISSGRSITLFLQQLQHLLFSCTFLCIKLYRTITV